MQPVSTRLTHVQTFLGTSTFSLGKKLPEHAIGDEQVSDDNMTGLVIAARRLS